MGRGYAAFWRKGSAGEFHGSSSASFVCGVSTIRARTSASQACRSTFPSLTPPTPIKPRSFYGSVEIDISRPVKAFDTILTRS